ncbi:putative gamma-tubulin complex component protein [Helianthus anomalus]
MNRVYHSSWNELCEGMAASGSLDEWALIASRINNILGLDLDFYSVQQTLNSGGTVAAIKARCHKEVDRIDKQFDDCMAFLLRVSIHPCIRLFLLGTVDSILSVF